MKLFSVALCTLIVAQVTLSKHVDDLQLRITKVIENNPELKSSLNEDVHTVRINQFRQFVKEFNRNYDSDTELEARFHAFVKNMEVRDLYQQHESGTAEYGFTKFSDYLEKELQRLFGECKNNGVLKGQFGKTEPEANLEDNAQFQDLVNVGNDILYGEVANFAEDVTHFDWRDKHFVGPVIDQGYCSSSWAYSAITTLEGAVAVENNKFTRLSKQQLIDCDYFNGGCCGGYPHRSFFYINKDGGLELDATYNGRRFVQRCHFDRKNAKVNVYGITMLTNTSTEYNELLMQKYVATKGPLAVTIHPSGLFNYKKGIIKQGDITCRKNPDELYHSVALVGFGEEGGQKYWIVKNSWGKNWGEKGYFRIERGSNMCGLAYYGTAPIVKKPEKK